MTWRLWWPIIKGRLWQHNLGATYGPLGWCNVWDFEFEGQEIFVLWNRYAEKGLWWRADEV